jgi:hypothetical protein
LPWRLAAVAGDGSPARDHTQERTTGDPRGGETWLTAKGLDWVRRFRRLTAGLQDLIEPRCAEGFEASGFFYRS